MGRYLNRIDFKASARPTVAVLRRLHLQHMLTVPFENLDIHLGRPIILDTRRFYRKIVEERRGGYCYELNGCFAWLLKKVGFKVSMMSARVARENDGFNPEFDHMVLLVSLKERFLVDVGFGDSFTEPKSIDTHNPEIDHGFFYRIDHKNAARILQRRDDRKSQWKNQYSFSLRPRRLWEFSARNRYQQTSTNSHFTKQRLISKLTQSGRITLTDSKLIITRDRERVERNITNKVQFSRLLAKYFQIELNE